MTLPTLRSTIGVPLITAICLIVFVPHPAFSMHSWSLSTLRSYLPYRALSVAPLFPLQRVSVVVCPYFQKLLYFKCFSANWPLVLICAPSSGLHRLAPQTLSARRSTTCSEISSLGHRDDCDQNHGSGEGIEGGKTSVFRLLGLFMARASSIWGTRRSLENTP